MNVSPLWEIKISTGSDRCEIGDNNMCHYNLGQFLNLNKNKKLYIAVKDVKVPDMQQTIEFKFFYGPKKDLSVNTFTVCEIIYNCY